MAIDKAAPVFFMGADTPAGFTGGVGSLYDPANGWNAFLIGGTPGNGKSTFLKRVYETHPTEKAELFCCSSDPSSLDAVRFLDRRVLLTDATFPHAANARFFGCGEYPLSLFPSVNISALLPVQKELQTLITENGALHERIRRLLALAADTYAQATRLALDSIDRDAVLALADRLASEDFDKGSGGTVSRRFLTAVTPDGVLPLYGTLQSLCVRITVIHDDRRAAASLLLQQLSALARKRGIEVIECPCTLFPFGAPEHLIFPSLGVGYTTKNAFHDADFPCYRRIHAVRFYDTETAQKHKQKTAFLQKTARECISEAVIKAKTAKAVHDEIESLYRPAIDDTKRERLFAQALDAVSLFMN